MDRPVDAVWTNHTAVIRPYLRVRGVRHPVESRRSEIRAGALVGPAPAATVGRSELGPHRLQLVLGRHLLGEEHGLHPLHQALEPADELGLGDLELGRRRDPVVGERQGQPVQLGPQVGRQRRGVERDFREISGNAGGFWLSGVFRRQIGIVLRESRES